MGSVLCLSYPDVLVPCHVAEEAGYTVTRTTQHGAAHGIHDPLPETTEFLKQMGAESIRYVDAIQARGVEEIVDLNEPADLGQHDLVIDPGTLEHCFNIVQALINATRAVKVGGHIFHINPLSMVNHGFWGLNPTTWHDFYAANGFEVLAMCSEAKNELSPVSRTGRFVPKPESSLFCVARKVADLPVKWPVQSKYKTAFAKAGSLID